MGDTIAINIEEGDTLIRNLCSDFVPYISDNTCTKTLFESSQAADFVAINKTNMILKPKNYDLTCYHGASHVVYDQDMYQCFPKTYQFTISALHLSNSQLIKEKVYSITVKNVPLSKTDKLILGGLMFGTLGGIYLISCCLAKQRVLCFRQQPQISQASVSKEMQPIQIVTSVESCPTTA